MSCEKCLLRNVGNKRVKVDGEGKVPAKIMLIGEAPGREEDFKGRPFVGDSGKLLDSMLAESGLQRGSLYITNVVKCRPPQNRSPKQEEVNCCIEFLEEEIEKVSPEIIVLLGLTAAKAILGMKDSIASSRGSVFEYKGSQVIVTYHPSAVLRELSLRGKVISDFKKVNSGTLVRKVNTVKVNKVTSLKDFCFLYRVIQEVEVVAYDIETTGLDWMKDKVVGINFAVSDKEGWFLSLLSESVIQELQVNRDDFDWVVWDNVSYQMIVTRLRELFSLDKLWLAHNGKFDDKFNNVVGIHSAVGFDTMLLHALFDETGEHGLKVLVKDLLNLEYKKESVDKVSKGGILSLSFDEAAEYGVLDVIGVYGLYKKFSVDLQGKSFERLFYSVVMPVQEVLCYMELIGVRIDQQKLLNVKQRIDEDLELLGKEMKELVGRDLNFNSPLQLGEYLVKDLQLEIKERTPTGRVKVDDGVLQGLLGKHPIIEKILSNRKLEKLKSTYVDGILEVIKEDGRVHTEYGMAYDEERGKARGAVTGRLSSANPNLQNTPQKDKPYGKEIRNSFIPAEGCKFLEFDFSQMELRVMAVISRDENLLKAYREGIDLHALTASYIYNRPVKEITSSQRQVGKGTNFAIIYGGQTEHMNGFFKAYPGVRRFQQEVVSRLRRDMQVTSIFGRVRRLPGINSFNQKERSQAERQAMNVLDQGVAADIQHIVTIRVFEMLCENYLDLRKQDYRNLLSWVSEAPKIVLSVHDSLLLEVPEVLVNEVKEKVVYEMTRPIEGIDIPLVVDVKVLDSWGG